MEVMGCGNERVEIGEHGGCYMAGRVPSGRRAEYWTDDVPTTCGGHCHRGGGRGGGGTGVSIEGGGGTQPKVVHGLRNGQRKLF